MTQAELFSTTPARAVDRSESGRTGRRGLPPAQATGETAAPAADAVEESDAEAATPTASAPSPAGPRSVAVRIVSLAQQGVLTDEERGELDTLLDRHINVGSTKQMRAFLYEQCGFPRRYIKQGARNTDKLSVAIDALLATFRQNKDPRLALCLKLSDRKTQLETLAWKLDKDGRMRTSLNIAGSEVGRMASNRSNTGSGGNLHTISHRHRQLFLADEGCDFYQIDLKSADTWTVACECAALGDPTMLDDLRADLKQAKIVALMYKEGAAVNKMSRVEIAERCASMPKDWLYLGCKRVVHGSNYGMGDVRMAEQILEDSYKGGGELSTFTVAQCKQLQNLYFQRYPGVKRWHERVKWLLVKDGALTAASGLRRDFFGKKDDHQTQKDAFPFCPAANTAYSCNLALLKLWQDSENRGVEGQRIARPLLTVHDAILAEAPIDRREWMLERVPVWFNNELEVAGTRFVIPFEIQRGPNWGQLKVIA